MRSTWVGDLANDESAHVDLISLVYPRIAPADVNDFRLLAEWH
jgi:hypothetical protein